MTADLTDVYLWLDRAYEHIQALESRCDEFVHRNPKPFDIRIETARGPDESVEYALYAIVREQPPRDLGVLIGDAVQSMRKALDYLAYEFSPRKYQKLGETAFPICDDAASFAAEGRKGIRGITGDALTFIENVQPYRRWKPPQADPLSILRRLSDTDKRTLLPTVVAAADDSESWIESNNAAIELTEFNPGPVEHDTKILSFVASPEDPTRKMSVNVRPGLEIQLEGTDSREVTHLLEVLHFAVSHPLNMWRDFGFLPQSR